MARIWQAWQAFIIGKRASTEAIRYKQHLTDNVLKLALSLQKGTYRHEQYHTFTLYDPKRREIAVANVNDRVVHRLLYDYLVPIWDKAFCYDAWSCRKGKGLHDAIKRAQHNTIKYRSGWLWRSDITKFFDSVDQGILKELLRTKLRQPQVLGILDEVIDSYQHELANQPIRIPNYSKHGIPIGNLTSQVFANIYLNELDQFVLHSIKPLGYVRYGDDIVLWCRNETDAHAARAIVTQFLADALHLRTNYLHDRIQPTRNKLAYLGVELWPTGRRLVPKVIQRIDTKLNRLNSSSYYALIEHHQPVRYRKRFLYRILDIIEQEW